MSDDRYIQNGPPEPTYIWVDDILPDLQIDYEHFSTFERTVLGPKLQELGYTLLSPWYTGDGDSFGPLSRCITTQKGIVVYG